MTKQEKINNILKIFDYYSRSRGVGHTKAMLEGANNVDCLVLVADSSQGKYLEQNGLTSKSHLVPKWVTIDRVMEDGLKELLSYRKPLLIDHYALEILINRLRELMLKETK